MKRFYSILITLLAASASQGQAVLNEIYAYPGAGNHEFFELYNTSTSDVPTTVDNYQLVAYFDDGKDKGFYVMDLPNTLIYPKGYFVGSSAIPFNYQSNLNSSQSDFNWNDPLFRNGSTGGYLRKWVLGGNSIGDKNPFYNEAPVLPDFNDFFSKLKGNGASFNTFLFKDGILMNSFLGGTGGTALIPSEIIDMPVLFIESVTANASPKYYATNFNKYKAIEAENVIQDIGSDNGYMRTRDGMCGTWEKSSAQAFHTPKGTNGSWSQMDIEGAMTLESHITRGLNPGDSSFITYRITSGPADAFAAEFYIYADNGSVDDEWDANDDFLKADTQYVANDTTFLTSFLPQDQELIIVIKTLQGCYDQVRLILNPEIEHTVLPIKLKAFTGKAVNDKVQLEWVVSGNESGQLFEVERSRDGKSFSKAGTVNVTGATDEAYYTFEELLSGNAYYRLKIVNKDKSVSYSPVVFVKEQTAASEKLFIVQNPVEATLVFTYQAQQTLPSTINIYNAVGVKLLTTQKTAQKGFNTYAINLDMKFTSGTYILEVVNSTERSVERFIKR
jgi:hypothetical protein